MKIKSVEAITLKYEIGEDQAYGMARGLASERGATLVIVHSDEGISGLGEAWGAAKATTEHVRNLAQVYLGQDPFDREIILRRTLSSLYHLGQSGPHIAALSGIDMALWDMIGKATGRPVSSLLGGRSRNKIMAYASTGYITKKDDEREFASQIEKAVEAGFKAIKIKIGISPEIDRQRVQITRRIAGEDTLLMVDANGNYKRDSALRCANLIEEFDIHWFEEPCSPEDLEGFRFLKEKTNIPLVAGEALFTRHGFRPYIEQGLVNGVQPDLSKCGGITEAKSIADLAHTWNLNVSAHVWGTAVGMAASLQFMGHLPSHPHTLFEPSPCLFEYDISVNPLRTHLINEDLSVTDGFIAVSDQPGLGITLNEHFLQKFRQ